MLKLDHLTIHNDDIGESVGDFHGTPVRQWDPRDTEERERTDARVRMANNRAAEANYTEEAEG